MNPTEIHDDPANAAGRQVLCRRPSPHARRNGEVPASHHRGDAVGGCHFCVCPISRFPLQKANQTNKQKKTEKLNSAREHRAFQRFGK